MKYLLFFLGLIIFTSCSNKPENCVKFKTGTFKFTDKVFKDYVIIRNDSLQIETNNKEKTKVTCSVKWLSDCEFILTPIESINFPDSIKLERINVKITETKGNRYKCTSSTESISYESEIIKVN
nr:DNA topoisomerase IV [uncultured Psychroserpens sp.]